MANNTRIQTIGRSRFTALPSVADGLNHQERVILYCLNKIQTETNTEYVSTIMLYGRVVEYLDISIDEMQVLLQRLIR